MYIEPIESPATSARWRTAAIEHLQLADRINEALRRHRVATVDDALRFAESCPSSFHYPTELKACVSQLRGCVVSEELDWSDYWLRRNFQFEQLAGDCCIFDQLAEKLAAYAVDRRSLGNAGAMLQASGIRSFPELVVRLKSGLGSVRGIGRTKIAELFERLFELAHALQEGRAPKLNPLHGNPTAGEPSAVDEVCEPDKDRPPFALSEDARQLPISVLQLGVKTQWLENAGHHTVGDVADSDLSSLQRLSAIGQRTVTAIREKLAGLETASQGGLLDWDLFARQLGVPLIPAIPLRSAREMLERLPGILGELAPHLRDDSYRSILLQRLAKRPGEQRKLEELAQESRPRVTRERIRQKEKKLIRQIAGGLIWDVSEKLGVQFHPTFVRYWRDAARAFEGLDDIPFDEFVSRLAGTWSVPPDAVIAQLPFIFSIVTGDPQLPAHFRPAAKLNPVLFRLDPAASSIPLRHLRLGRKVEKLEGLGVADLGALVQRAASGREGDDTLAVLNTLADCVDEGGRFDWKEYSDCTELALLPSSSTGGPAGFAAGFCDEICRLLAAIHSSDRRCRIFRLRTSEPQHRRPTLDAVAKLLVTHGPTVKREETELLQDLHDILVEGDFSCVPYWLQEDWLTYVRDAVSVFGRCGRDFAVFQAALANVWALHIRELEAAVPAMWAIFTGYPQGIKRGRRRVPPPEGPVEPARVRLRGFRRLH